MPPMRENEIVAGGSAAGSLARSFLLFTDKSSLLEVSFVIDHPAFVLSSTLVHLAKLDAAGYLSS